MLSRVCVSAALLGLFLAGPAIGDSQSTKDHPAALDDITALTIDSDITVFMQKEVPEGVRQAALRRLWVLMKLPMSCHDLCHQVEPADSQLAQLATDKLVAAAQ